jgi:hypothetical protein
MRMLLPAVLLCLLTGAGLYGQTYEFGVHAAYPRFSDEPLGSISPVDGEDTDTVLKGNRIGYGARITLNTKGYYGHEFGYTLHQPLFRTTVRNTVDNVTVTTQKEDRVKLHLGYYNFLIYFMPRGERWRPYITGGLQMYQYQGPNIPEYPGGNSRTYGGNYGAGFKLKLFKHALVRWDFRHYLGGKPYDLQFEDVFGAGGIFTQMEGTFGLSITF